MADSTRPGRFGRGWALLGLAINLPFALCHPAAPIFSAGLPRSLAINLVLFILPGAALCLLAEGFGRLKRPNLLWIVAGSLAVFIGAAVFARGIGGAASASLIWNLSWGGTNALLLGAWFTGVAVPYARVATSAARLGILVFAVCYLSYFWAATRIVPEQGDHDLDLQGPAHALLTELKPAYPTSRSYYYLAHPPLLHVYVAGSFLYFGELDRVAVYNPSTPSALSPDEHWRYYVDHPFFLETRTPNVFLSAMTVALLATWLTRLLGQPGLALLIAGVYATLPEVFVRSSYGGYFAGSKFFALQMLLAVDGWAAGAPLSVFRTGLAGFLAALANHKLVLLPLAIGIWRLVNVPWRAGAGAAFRHLLHPVIVGFGLGSCVFWAYGAWVSPTDFWNDHVRHHIVDRVMSHNARGLDMSRYPTLPGLWWEFLRDTSYLLIPAGVLALVAVLLVKPSSDPHSKNPRTVWATQPALWAIWALVATAAFSLIDWKQTKHLTTLIPPLILGPAAAVATRRLPARLVAVVFGLMIAISLVAIATLAWDFRSLVKVPEW